MVRHLNTETLFFFAGQRATWTLPSIADYVSGTFSESFALPKPFDHRMASFFVQRGPWMSLYTAEGRPQELAFKLSIRGRKTDEYLDLSYEHSGKLFGNPKVLTNLEENWTQEDGSLIIDCDITIKSPSINLVRKCFQGNSRDYMMAKAFEEERFADFTLICQGKTINIAKAVVGSQSDFFGKMFETNMKESKSGKAEINNMSFDTLKLLLRYIYCGDIPADRIKRDVLVAADYLNIEKIKEIYEEYTLQNITIGSVHESLLDAKTFNLIKLNERCMTFLRNDDNWKSVVAKMVDILEPLV